MPRTFRRCSLEKLESRCLLAGDLDPAFGNDGLIFDEISHPVASDDRVAEAIVDTEGRIVVAVRSTSGRGNSAALARVLPDGSLDMSFGQQGKVFLGVSNGAETIKDVVVQPDGKLVVLSEIRNADANNSCSVHLTRLKSNGDLDLTFGNGGMINPLYRYPLHYHPAAMVLAADGSLFVLSTFGHSAVLSKHLPTGDLDTSFGESGLANIAGDHARALDVLYLPDHTFLVAVEYNSPTGDPLLTIKHVLSSGVFDGSFGGGTPVIIPLGSNGGYGGYGQARLAIGHDLQSVFVAGTRRTLTAQDFFVRKMTLSGLPVESFGQGGERFIPSGQAWGTLLQGLELQSDGTIILTGTLSNFRRPTLVRVTASGLIDRSRTSNGYNTIADIITRDDLGAAVLLPGGKPIAVVSDRTTEDVLLIAYQPNGTRDLQWGSQGTTLINMRSLWTGIEGQDILELPGGQVLTVAVDWLAEIVDGAPIGPKTTVLTRYSSTGELDATFGDEGRVTIRSNALWGNLPATFLVRGNERFLAIQDQYVLRIARLTDAGLIDTDFGVQGWIAWPFPYYGNTSGEWDEIDSVVATSDGFLVSGHGPSNSGGEVFTIVKISRSGGIDSSFGDYGSIRIPARMVANRCELALQSDERFVVLLSSTPDGLLFQSAIQRYTATGKLDESFGIRGTTNLWLESSRNYLARRQLIVLPDDRLIITGRQYASIDGNPVVVTCLLADGQVDTNFGLPGSGWISLPCPRDLFYPHEVLIDPVGRILVSSASSDTLQIDTVIHRLTATGAIDSTFGSDGIQWLPLGDFNDRVIRLANTASGDTFAAGSRTTKDSLQAVYLRLLEGEIPPSPWQNPAQPLDANANQYITPLDALLVINYLNSGAARKLPGIRPPDTTLAYLDVNGDRNVSPIDALLVINELNRRQNGNGESSGEGESSLAEPTRASRATSVDQLLASESSWRDGWWFGDDYGLTGRDNMRRSHFRRRR